MAISYKRGNIFMKMKKQFKILFSVFVLAFTLIISSQNIVQAKPYWDSREGAYINKVYHQPRKGYELYYPGQGQFKQAALRRYNSINRNATYYFNFTNVVRQAHLFSMKGHVKDVVCVYRN